MTYGDMLWINILVEPLGSVFLASMALIGIILFLCASRGISPDKTVLITTFTVSGLSAEGMIPIWILGGLVIFDMIVIFTAVSRRILNG